MSIQELLGRCFVVGGGPEAGGKTTTLDPFPDEYVRAQLARPRGRRLKGAVNENLPSKTCPAKEQS